MLNYGLPLEHSPEDEVAAYDYSYLELAHAEQNNAQIQEPDMPEIPNDLRDPMEIFLYVLPEARINRICDLTNQFRANNDPHGKRETQAQGYPRSWSPMTIDEFWAFLGVLVYTQLHAAPQPDMYWNEKDDRLPFHPLVRKHMSSKRYQQIDRFVKFCQPKMTQRSPYREVKHILSHIQSMKKEFVYKTYKVIIELYDQLFKKSDELRASQPSKPARNADQTEIELFAKKFVVAPKEDHFRTKIRQLKECVFCKQFDFQAKAAQQRKSLGDLAASTLARRNKTKGDIRPKRHSRTTHICGLCEQPICKTTRCWLGHMEIASRIYEKPS